MADFIDKYKKLIGLFKVKQIHIAEKLGVKPQQINKILNKQKDVSFSLAVRLINALPNPEKVNLEWLFFDKGEVLKNNSPKYDNNDNILAIKLKEKMQTLHYKNIALDECKENKILLREKIDELQAQLESKDQELKELRAKLQNLEELLKNIRAKQD